MSTTAAEPTGAPRGGSTGAVLEIDDLHVTFKTEDGPVYAVRGVDLAVHEGETLGVVGESGSGKSVTMLAAMGLLPKSATITGSVKFRGQELLGLDKNDVRHYRGSKIAMIFQDPLTALNPVLKVGDQIAEAVTAHQGISGNQAHASRDRDARPRRHPAAGHTRRPVPSRVLGRHAPEGDDRDGDLQRPRSADRGRADNRARRDHPGPDPRGHPAGAGGDEVRGRLHHPRPRCHRPSRDSGARALRGPQCRGRQRRRHLREPRRTRTRSACCPRSHVATAAG